MPLVIAIIAAVAAGIGWFVLHPDCSGREIGGLATCARTSGLGQAECERLFADANAQLRKVGATFENQSECNRSYVNCQRAAPPSPLWVPAANGICVEMDSFSRVSRVVPRISGPER